MEVISDVGDRGGAREQRDDEQADDLAAAPERQLGGERRVAAFAHPGQTLLVPGDERESKRT